MMGIDVKLQVVQKTVLVGPARIARTTSKNQEITRWHLGPVVADCSLLNYPTQLTSKRL